MVFIKNYIRNSVIETVILKNIPKEFKEVDILLLEKLVNIFLSNPGQYLRFDELSKEMGRAKTTLYKAIFYLEFSFLIKRVLNFRSSIRVASRKLSRLYAYHPCLLLELGAKYYWREKDKEIDFLKNSLAIEVKLKTKISKEDIRSIEFFLKNMERKVIKLPSLQKKTQKERWAASIYFRYGNFV